VYLNIVPTWFTLLAAIMLFIAMYIVLHVLQGLEHKAYGYEFNSNKKSHY
jgi:hypothetical protein